MQKHAVVLFNMGGPGSLFEVESFLRNLFADPLILTIPSTFLRKMLANLIISKRLDEAKNIYAQLGGSSKLTPTTLKLTQKLCQKDDEKFYTYCMRYSPPFALDVIGDLQKNGVEKITFFSMYPQYSTTTTKSSLVDITDALKKLQYSPKIKVVERYFNDRKFCALVAQQILKKLDVVNSEVIDSKKADDWILLFSAHSIPENLIKKGDNYPKECEQQVQLVREILESKGAHFKQVLLGYQSKVGPMKWVGPATFDLLAKMGGKNVLVFALSFNIDNSETDYELKIEGAQVAKNAGVAKYEVVECFNDDAEFADFVIDIINETNNE